MQSIIDILHKNFQEDHTNSKRFPGDVDTLVMLIMSVSNVGCSDLDDRWCLLRWITASISCSSSSSVCLMSTEWDDRNSPRDIFILRHTHTQHNELSRSTHCMGRFSSDLSSQSHKQYKQHPVSEWVSSFLAAHHFNLNTQCHSCWQLIQWDWFKATRYMPCKKTCSPLVTRPHLAALEVQSFWGSSGKPGFRFELCVHYVLDLHTISHAQSQKH